MRRFLLSLVLSRISSHQSPSISAERVGLDFDPLFLLHSSQSNNNSLTPSNELYLDIRVPSSNSRDKSPSHQEAILIEIPRVAGLITSPFIFHITCDAIEHITTRLELGSISAAIQRPTSILLLT